MQTKPLMQINLSSWQQQLREAVTDPQTLIRQLNLPEDLLKSAEQASKDFSLRVPQPFLERMEPGNPFDPLLLQVLPVSQELDQKPGYVTDPLGEADANQQPGIVHKYRGRVLLIVSGGCAINCRYCFRRHFPYQDNQLGGRQWQQTLNYLAADRSIQEVILSGGDPLLSTDSRLQQMVSDLEQITHLKRLRIHTRLPVVIPDRITDSLLSILSDTTLSVVVVNHINHPNEIDSNLEQALARLRQLGITLLNQTVLLKSVNDDSEVLIALSEKLFENGVLPYYLHLLDPVTGVAHFDIEEQHARRLVGTMADQLPGYLVPRLVRELAGASAKVPIMPELGANGGKAEDANRIDVA